MTGSVDWESFTDRTVEAAEVRLLGTVELPSVLALQKLFMHEVRQQGRMNAGVMICEHPPAITVGTSGNILGLPADPRDIESRSLEVIRVRRDGGTILHQPGQLAIYVMVSLQETLLTDDEFRERLGDAVVAACREAQVAARRNDSDPAVIAGRHGMIAEVGIQVENGVTGFGVVLNVGNRLDEARAFGRGLNGERISSLSAERVRPVIMPQIRAALIRHICEHMGYPDYHIHTGHPFLQRVSRSDGATRAAENETV